MGGAVAAYRESDLPNAKQLVELLEHPPSPAERQRSKITETSYPASRSVVAYAGTRLSWGYGLFSSSMRNRVRCGFIGSVSRGPSVSRLPPASAGRRR
jgi:hypothetical protein